MLPLSGHPSGKCRHHAAAEDPALAAQVAQERVQGGKTGRMSLALRQLGLDLGEIDLTKPADIRRVLAQTAQAVAAGRIPASVAGSISQLVNSALRVAEVELSAQLKALETQLALLEQERSGRR